MLVSESDNGIADLSDLIECTYSSILEFLGGRVGGEHAADLTEGSFSKYASGVRSAKLEPDCFRLYSSTY